MAAGDRREQTAGRDTVLSARRKAAIAVGVSREEVQ
jgi:hypothetical protein